MAVNAYLEIDGVSGPSTSKANCIDILSFSFGASQTSTYGEGASGNEAKSGRAQVSDVSIRKVADKTTPFLFDHCVSGDILSKVTLYYDKPVKDKQEDYFKLELTDALITSISLDGSKEHPTESVTFAFQKICVAYAAEKDDGTLDAFVPKCFDASKLVPC
ncbi:MAG TPA: type VI secretion system tube protein Hcp [Bryobacteraceae bacterium]|nr:type VI secretion system tube protein Hcp [Bryobacteraceae bacterium]